MAYDESSYRRRDAQSAAEDYPTAGLTIGDFRDSEQLAATERTPAVLDDVFDDPDHGEPGRDRMAVHVLWEVLLLLGVAALAVLIYREDPAVLRGAALDSLLVAATALGLLALAAGLTLRAGAPNLALGPVAIAAAQYFAGNGDRGVAEAIGVAAVAAAVLGLALALFVVGFQVPAWAASLALGLALVVFVAQRTVSLELPAGWDPARHSIYLFGGFMAVAVLGGLFGTVKAIRRAVGRFRPVADPARRRGGAAAVVTAGAIVLSMVMASLGGVLLVGGAPTVSPWSGIEWTGLALGAALLAGTSAYGRRGGVFGTVFVVALLTLFVTYSVERGWDIAPGAVAAVAIAAGLVVTRLVETFGRPRAAAEEDGEREESTTTSSWSGGGFDRDVSWSAALPAQPTDPHDVPWRSDRWSATDR